MSTFLNQISSGSHQEGVRIVIAGQEKVGKTTLACQAPNPLLVPLEIGYADMTCPKTPMLQNYNEIEALMAEITAQAQQGQFPFKSIVFDSVTAMERMLHESVVKLDPGYSPGNKKTVTMDSALGGYGKAFAYANEKFATLLRECDNLAVYGGINIVFTCHVFAAKVIDPTAGEFDSWDLLLHSPKNNKTYGKREMMTQWADIVGFLYEPMYLTQTDKVARAVSANRGRVLGMSRTPSYVAGNRFRTEGEISVSLVDGWNHMAEVLQKNSGINLFSN